MRKTRLLPVLVCALGLGLAACSEDMGGEPGDQGAGRPGSPQAPEDVPAKDVLTNAATHPEHMDSTAAGAPGMAATIRDTSHSHEGEAIPSIQQPKPRRPADPSTADPR